MDLYYPYTCWVGSKDLPLPIMSPERQTFFFFDSPDPEAILNRQTQIIILIDFKKEEEKLSYW